VDFVSIVGGCYTKKIPSTKGRRFEKPIIITCSCIFHFTKQLLSFFPMIHPTNIHWVSEEIFEIKFHAAFMLGKKKALGHGLCQNLPHSGPYSGKAHWLNPKP
jgi:hypothetical protein